MTHPSYLLRRFWSRVQKDPEGCWIWTGPLHDGYGRFRISPTVRKYAHVFVYEIENGPVPEGAETIAGPLAPPFTDLCVTVAVVPDRAGRLLPLLWTGLSVLLLVGLATGVLLGLRAVMPPFLSR